MRLPRIVCTVVLSVAAWCDVISAQVELDLIDVFHSDSTGSFMWEGCMSPGDINGDGFSEIFVAEQFGAKRLLVFSGGNPHDTLPDMIIPDRSAFHDWLPDLNGDGYDDLVTRLPSAGDVERIQIWFGGEGFLAKTEPDMIIHNWDSRFHYYGRRSSSGDLNGDGQNDLVVAAPNADLPFDGRFYVYYGGDLLDTLPDDYINVYYTHEYYNDFYWGNGIGDINGDGLFDLAYSGLRGNHPGYVAVILGGTPLDSLPDYTIWSPGWQEGDSHEFGEWVYPLGDINRDGYDDFAVCGGELWRPYIFFGGNPFDTIPLMLGDTTDNTTKGSVVARIGDINHDGWDDIAVGFPDYALETGLVNIYYGYRNLDPEPDLMLNGNDVWPISGRSFGEYIGPAGDFNGDGVDDVVISSWQYYSGGEYDRGSVYVFSGDSSLPTSADGVEDDSQLPTTYNILEQNYPNPFNSSTVIEYDLFGAYNREIELSVYNILGHRIRVLKRGVESGGHHTATWDGLNDFGDTVPSGVYFYQLRSDGQRISKKMLYLK